MRTKATILAVTASVIVLGTAFLGYSVVSAQEADTSSILSKVAQILNISEEDLTNAFKQAKIDEVNSKVESGELDADKAAEIIERIENSEFFGFGQHRKRKGRREYVKPGIKDVMDFLGIDFEEAMQYRHEGKTPAEIAEEKGVSYEELKSFVISEIKEAADKALEDGTIDQEKHDKIYENAEERAEMMLNHEPKNRGFGPMNDKGNPSQPDMHNQAFNLEV
ncbi:hypothetical protein GF362_03730 [Candidatus Dojkabacteria bacterium]|nr:hypothetical protein [Candidatus Dojkabacteria bacterium]